MILIQGELSAMTSLTIYDVITHLWRHSEPVTWRFLNGPKDCERDRSHIWTVIRHHPQMASLRPSYDVITCSWRHNNTIFRWVTSACMLDYSTVVIGDKFGSISVIRLPKDTNEDTQVNFSSKNRPITDQRIVYNWTFVDWEWKINYKPLSDFWMAKFFWLTSDYTRV